MIKLSRSGWNNVIIFSVMGFILLINLTQKNTFMNTTPEHTEQFLIAEHAVILSLTVNQQTHIERIGQTWRSMPSVIEGQPLSAMMSAWHQVSGTEIKKPEVLDKTKAIVVSVVLAGQDIDEYFMLLPSEQELIIYKQSSDQWLSVAAPIFSQLIPNEVMM